MHAMNAAARAILLQFHTARIITPVFLRDVIPFFALGAGQDNYWTDIFLFRGHTFLPAAMRDRFSFLLNNLGDHARADGKTAFTDRKF